MTTPNRSPEVIFREVCLVLTGMYPENLSDTSKANKDCAREIIRSAILTERAKVEEANTLLSELGEALDLIFKGADEVERMNTTNALRDLMNIILSKKLLLAKYTTFKSLTEQSEKEK